MLLVEGPSLPDAEPVTGGVRERRDPEIAFRIRCRGDLASVLGDLLEDIGDLLDVDIRGRASLARNGQVLHEVPDDVTGAILEARIRSAFVDVPTEDGPIERGRPVGVRSRHPEVGDPSVPEDGVTLGTVG